MTSSHFIVQKFLYNDNKKKDGFLIPTKTLCRTSSKKKKKKNLTEYNKNYRHFTTSNETTKQKLNLKN